VRLGEEAVATPERYGVATEPKYNKRAIIILLNLKITSL